MGLQRAWQPELDFPVVSLHFYSLTFLAKFSEVPLRGGKVRGRNLVVLAAGRR